jgi:hypothetical protein
MQELLGASCDELLNTVDGGSTVFINESGDEDKTIANGAILSKQIVGYLQACYKIQQ